MIIYLKRFYINSRDYRCLQSTEIDIATIIVTFIIVNYVLEELKKPKKAKSKARKTGNQRIK